MVERRQKPGGATEGAAQSERGDDWRTDLIDALDAIVWLAEPSTLRFRFVSGRAEPLLGFPIDDWLSDPDFFKKHSHPEEFKTTVELVRDVAATGRKSSFVHRLQTAAGDERWFQTTTTVATESALGPRLVAGLMLDITERRIAQNAWQVTDERLRLITEQIPGLVYTLDRQLRFTSGLGAALHELGLQSERTLLGISLPEYFHTSDPNHPQIARHRRALAGEVVDFETEWVGRSYTGRLEPFRDELGNVVGVIGAAVDVTERKRAEAERERLLAAETAARLAAEKAVRVRDEFLSTASHELRTPVTSLQLVLQSLARGAREGGPALSPKMLTVAEQQGRRLATLIDQLLDVARIETGRLVLTPESVDLGGVAREVCERMQAEATENGSRLRLRVEENLVGRWDRSRIDQMVSNLLSNAIKYGEGKPIDIVVAHAETKACLTVRDRGIGIARERVPHIFERFERAVSSRNYGGLGLGLFIVSQIVQLHQGTVRVQTAPGRGSTFVVELPFEPHGMEEQA